MTLYAYTEERAYWAGVIQSDISKGRNAKRAVRDVEICLMLTGRFSPMEAKAEAGTCAYFAGVVDQISE